MISHRNDETGSVRKDVGHRTDGGADHRNAGSKGFQCGDRQPFEVGADHTDVEGGRQPLRLGPFAGPDDRAVEPEAPRRLDQGRTSWAVADHADRYVAPIVAQLRRSAEQHLVRLLLAEAGDNPHDEGSRVEPELGTGLLTGQRRIEPDAVGDHLDEPARNPLVIERPGQTGGRADDAARYRSDPPAVPVRPQPAAGATEGRVAGNERHTGGA